MTDKTLSSLGYIELMYGEAPSLGVVEMSRL